MSSYKEFFDKAASAFSPLITWTEGIGLFQNSQGIDHICYRVPSLEKYTFWCDQMVEWKAELLSEAPVNGRLISTFKLPVEIKLRDSISTRVLEIPSPKKNSPYPEGFEHFEIVTITPLKEIPTLFPNLNWNTSNINKKLNPDISIKKDNLSIKLHSQSLEEIIQIEKMLEKP